MLCTHVGTLACFGMKPARLCVKVDSDLCTPERGIGGPFAWPELRPKNRLFWPSVRTLAVGAAGMAAQNSAQYLVDNCAGTTI